MTKYTEQEFIIKREKQDGSISFIPKDAANSDFQAWLKSLKPAKNVAEQSKRLDGFKSPR